MKINDLQANETNSIIQLIEIVEPMLREKGLSFLFLGAKVEENCLFINIIKPDWVPNRENIEMSFPLDNLAKYPSVEIFGERFSYVQHVLATTRRKLTEEEIDSLAI